MEALIIMIIGMTGVALFLSVLVGLMILVTRLAPYTAPPPSPAVATVGSTPDQVIAVIQAAITAYESDKR